MDKLNSEQLKAVKTIDGSVLILAGAGSGKTKTLIERVAFFY
jgi:DNA helicase-2/ATP-dependent DNA helicase PcrA